MISNPPISPIQVINKIIPHFGCGMITQIKVNIVNFPNLLRALNIQQSVRNSYIARLADDDFFVINTDSEDLGSDIDIEELRKSCKEKFIRAYKEDISIYIPKNPLENPINSAFKKLTQKDITNYLNRHLAEIGQKPENATAIINLGLENFKDTQEANFFMDTFSKFSTESQDSVIESAISKFNYDFIDEFLKYKNDDPKYLLLSTIRKDETAKVPELLKGESNLPSYSLVLFISTIRTGNLEMTKIILENQEIFAIETLFYATTMALKNKIETIDLFLPKLRNINEPYSKTVESLVGCVPLMHSITHNNLETTDYLLEIGANVNIVVNNETPLIKAINQKNVTIVGILLNRGADIDKRPSENGDTPLINAIRKKHVKIVKLLLDRGANSDKLDSEGLSAIHIASKENNFEIVRILVEKNKGNVNFVVPKGEFEKFTPLHFATLNNNPEMVEFLLKNNAKTEKTTKNGEETALHIAVKNGNTKIVQLLLDKEIDKKNLNSSLHIAIEGNNPEILKLLLEKGANPNMARSDGLTPIGIAIIYRRDNLLSVLLESEKLDFNSIIQSGNYKNYTPIHIASSTGNAKALERLLDKGKVKTRELINKPVGNGVYPIHLATKSKDLETVTFLSRNGANVDQITADGLTSRDIAVNIEAGDEIMEILLKASKDKKTKKGKATDTPLLHFAIMNSDISYINELITYENVDQLSPKGYAPLHIVCDSPYNEHESDFNKTSIEIIKALLEKGAQINIEASGNFRGFTPLHFAVYNDNIFIARFLLDNNADINKYILNEKYFPQSPLGLAILKNTSIEMISFLLEKGAEILIDADNEFGHFFDNFTFDLVDESREDIMRLLLKNMQENNQSFDYSSLFHFVVSKNKINFVKILLEMEEISFNAPNCDGQTALHVAISNQSTPILIELLKSEKIDLNIIVKGLCPVALAQFLDYNEGEKLLIEEGNRRDALNNQDSSVEDLNPVRLEGRKVYEEIRKISKSLRDKTKELAISPPSLINLLKENPEEIFSPQNQKNSATIFQFVATHPECVNILKDILECLKSLSLLDLINEDRAMAKTKSTEKISIPPLYSAISFENLEGARSLVEAGADVNFRVTSGQFSLLEVLLRNLKRIEELPESNKIKSQKVENIFAMTKLLTGENKRGDKILFSDEESQKIIKSLDKIPSHKIRILNILQKKYPENEFFQEAKIGAPNDKLISGLKGLRLDSEISPEEDEIEVIRFTPNPNAGLRLDRLSRNSENRLDQAKTRHNA